jgi:hypothetical protein
VTGVCLRKLLVVVFFLADSVTEKAEAPLHPRDIWDWPVSISLLNTNS